MRKRHKFDIVVFLCEKLNSVFNQVNLIATVPYRRAHFAGAVIANKIDFLGPLFQRQKQIWNFTIFPRSVDQNIQFFVAFVACTFKKEIICKTIDQNNRPIIPL